ncbi:MAG TPA: hypothetical protein VF063_09455 [Gaiellaceae bacterium]
MAAAACLLLLAPLAGASNDVAYSDATGDGAVEAPDVGAVRVANDDAGRIVFRISITNRTSLAPTDMVAVFVDADGKAGTGCARGVFGAEYALDVLAGRYVFGRCVTGSWSFGQRPATFSGSFADATLTLAVNRRALGGTGRFAFRIGAATTTESRPAYDFAPDVGTGAWSYQVVAPPPAAFKPPKMCRRHPRRCRLRPR